jgi:hypothetical protein
MPIGYALTFLTLRDTLACIQTGVMGVELTDDGKPPFVLPGGAAITILIPTTYSCMTTPFPMRELPCAPAYRQEPADRW